MAAAAEPIAGRSILKWVCRLNGNESLSRFVIKPQLMAADEVKAPLCLFIAGYYVCTAWPVRHNLIYGPVAAAAAAAQCP